MNFRVLELGITADEEEWMKLWRALPVERQDVFFLPGYLESYHNEKRGKGMCAAIVENKSVLLYPFLKREITYDLEKNTSKQYYDITTPYGYGGPVVNLEGEDTSFLTKAWENFSIWCREQSIVTEFCRFHSIISNSGWVSEEMTVLKDRDTVAFDLKKYPTDVWNSSYFLNHRGMVRKAIREEFTFHVENFEALLPWFVEKYNETQEKLQASQETIFSETYFRTLQQKLQDRIWLGVVRKNNEPVTAVLVLEGNRDSYLHLMAYFNEGPAKGMVNYLYHEVANEEAKKGLCMLQVGGGKTNSPDDPLFLFKARLSPVRHEFHIGKRVHDQKKYDELVDNYKMKYGEDVYDQKRRILQFYE